ncbi:MAG: 50S ribosomal protein L32 [Rickettsiales bacterium]
MAVPKKKVSKSRRNQRRAHDSLAHINVVVNKTTGEYQLPHQVSIDGYYKGKKVIADKVKKEEENKEENLVQDTEQKKIASETA